MSMGPQYMEFSGEYWPAMGEADLCVMVNPQMHILYHVRQQGGL